jgi:NAD(P)-dependent dehydrogenase (short-subunit alcohol dehydrogenase family)
MCPIEASELLRPGLLEGVSVLLASAPGPAAHASSPSAAIGAVLVGLGAHVAACSATSQRSDCADLPDLADEEAAGEVVKEALAENGSIDVLVVDGAGLFAYGLARDGGAGGGPRGALRTCLDASWNLTRAVANLALLPGGREGRIVYLAPAPDGGEHAEPARAGLENLSRTLSIEWARHRITAVTVAPGAQTSPTELAALSAFLASPAGGYFSGCLLDLRGPAGR